MQIRLKDAGSELIEVADNGTGIYPQDYEALTLKYHTSKLSQFSDLEVRGCALDCVLDIAKDGRSIGFCSGTVCNRTSPATDSAARRFLPCAASLMCPSSHALPLKLRRPNWSLITWVGSRLDPQSHVLLALLSLHAPCFHGCLSGSR